MKRDGPPGWMGWRQELKLLYAIGLSTAAINLAGWLLHARPWLIITIACITGTVITFTFPVPGRRRPR